MSSVQERPPYEAYAAIAGSFAGLLAAAGALSRLLDRDPQCQTSLDFAILALASFKAARTLAHDRVSAPMRAPFVAMVNLIGELPDVQTVAGLGGVHLHLYGKSAAPGRKLGHITVIAPDTETLITRLTALHALL